MTDTLYVQLLDLTCGALLLTAVLILWRRELAVIIRVFAWQGLALAILVAVLAAHEKSAELAVVAGKPVRVCLPAFFRCRALMRGPTSVSGSRPDPTRSAPATAATRSTK